MIEGLGLGLASADVDGRHPAPSWFCIETYDGSLPKTGFRVQGFDLMVCCQTVAPTQARRLPQGKTPGITSSATDPPVTIHSVSGNAWLLFRALLKAAPH